MTRVLMYAPIMTRSGYGDHARDLAYSIIQNEKYSLEVFPTNWGSTSWNGLDETTEQGKLIAKHIKKSPTPNPDIFIQLTIPNEFVRMGKYNIGITAGIETDLCKPEWIEGANNMDMVIGVSEHAVKILKETKYDKLDNITNTIIGSISLKENLRLETLFEGVDTDVYKKNLQLEESIRKGMAEIKEDFCFLFVGHWLDGEVGQDRKDVGMLIKTFCEAFKTKPPSTRPALILKTSGGTTSITDKFILYSKINKITDTVENSPNVYLIHGDLTQSEMNSLYNHPKVKAMVSFTKGEGFGRPLLEFSTTGKPIIASKWSGQLDFLHPEYTALLPGQLTPVHSSVVNNWFMKEAKWFTVDYAFAARVLQGVHKNYEQYKKLAQKQKTHTESNFTLKQMNKKLYEILDSISIDAPVSMSLPKLKKI
jgi:glycosyltransferase involved in cell wall biosynthesis